MAASRPFATARSTTARKAGCGVFEHGKGTVEGCDIFANKLAGVAISEGGDPTIRDCKIHDNEGGVFV